MNPASASFGFPEQSPAAEDWHFSVVVATLDALSDRTIRNLRALCRDHLTTEPRIDVVELGGDPRKATELAIFAVPTVIRHHPGPTRKVIGDLSDRARAIDGLMLPSEP